MKRNVSLLVGIILLACFTSNAQVLVRAKPVSPKVVVVKSKRPSSKHVLVKGHWKWNNKIKKYKWVNARWVRPKNGYVWVAGSWKNKPNGFIWKEGYWRKAVA